MSITVLWSGIDTLEASYRAVLDPDLVTVLDALKVTAQTEEQPQPYEIGGYSMGVHAQGLKPWRFLLTGEDLHLRLSPSGSAPNISLRLLSLGLLAYGHESLFELGEHLVHSCSTASGLGLSRLDLACDFQGFVPTFADSQRIVCAASFRPIYPNTEHPETFQFGQGDIVVRIYNKSREIEIKGKGYWREVWAQHPDFDPETEVWRFELQLRRGALAEYGCRDPRAAFANLDRLLGSGLDWANLRIPKGMSTDRWDEDPAWTQLREATFAGAAIPRVKAASYVGGTAKLVPMAAGILVSVAARLGIRDRTLASEVLDAEIQQYFEERGINFEREVAARQVKIDGSRKELQSG